MQPPGFPAGRLAVDPDNVNAQASMRRYCAGSALGMPTTRGINPASGAMTLEFGKAKGNRGHPRKAIPKYRRGLASRGGLVFGGPSIALVTVGGPEPTAVYPYYSKLLIK